MLINEKVVTRWSGNNRQYYTKLGYKYTKYKNEFMVLPKDLTKNSKVKVKVICDCCGDIFQRRYQDYIKCHIYGFDCCNKESCKSIKRRMTNKKLYGHENVMHSEIIKQKLRNSNIEKYGIEHPQKLDWVKKKAVNTNRIKYGYDYPVQDKKRMKNAQIKMKNTMLKRYGVDCVFKLPEYRKRIYETFIQNCTIPASKPQNKLYELILNSLKFKTVKENYFVEKSIFDIYVETKSGIKIDIEYDNPYHHKPQKDRCRDEFIKSLNYKILRIKGRHKVPTIEQIDKAIDYLENGNNYCEIKLEDWDENLYISTTKNII